ncbi:histidine phosphatase family protein [Leucobacter zeae]|nr:histidine phosphatase family protein [Leucobacter zeae]
MTHSIPNAIAVVRHGETDWNLARRIQGRTEVPLNSTGREQAAATAALLAEMAGATGAHWRRVVSSPLGRAIETARIIADGLGASGPHVDPELWERDFGQAEGLLVDDVHERWPGLDIPGAETIEAMTARTSAAFARILDTAPGTIVVAHGAMIRAGLGSFSEAPIARVENGAVWLLRRDAPSGAPRVDRLPAQASPRFRAQEATSNARTVQKSFSAS